MTCIAVHVDTKATEFEIARQISFLKIFRKRQLQQTITASLLFSYYFHLLYSLFHYSHHFLFLSEYLNFIEALY